MNIVTTVHGEVKCVMFQDKLLLLLTRLCLQYYILVYYLVCAWC